MSIYLETSLNETSHTHDEALRGYDFGPSDKQIKGLGDTAIIDALFRQQGEDLDGAKVVLGTN